MIKEDEDIRDGFFDDLLKKFKKNKKVFFLTADQGTFKLQEFIEFDQKRVINVGISEQHLISFASGLASAGNIVYVYAISSFLILRAFEQIKVDLVFNNPNVKIIGMGTGFCYSQDGPTHHSLEDISVLRPYSNINIFTPSNSITSELISNLIYKNTGLDYIRLDKGRFDYNGTYGKTKHLDNLVVLKKGNYTNCIISCGVILNTVFKNYFDRENLQIIDIYKSNSITDKTINFLSKFKKIITIEENIVNSSIGSILESHLTNSKVKIIKIGASSLVNYEYGSRDYLIDKIILNEKNKKGIDNFLN